jgi:aspartokinase
VLAVLDRYDIVPDLAVCEQYQLSLSMDLDESVQQDFIEEMSAELTTEVNLHYGQIALIGCSEKLNRYLWQYVFKELQDIPVYLVGQGQERQTLILTVPSEHTLKAVARLHSHLCIQNSDMLEYRVEDHSN